MLVTGRHHTAAYPYYHELNLTTPMICCNGTYVYQPQTDQVLSANPLSLSQAKTVVQLAEKYGLHLLVYSRDAMNYAVLNEHMRKFSMGPTLSSSRTPAFMSGFRFSRVAG